MRIVGGKWRSRRLIRPRGLVTRPMPDRVREAVFSALGSRYECPGMLPPLTVADVFAGSGSMGLEALSRGARSCCFFERNREVLVTLYRNLDALGVGPEATVVGRDAWSAAVCSPSGRPFDLILLDPPYADTRDMSPDGPLKRYLGRLAERRDNLPLVVLHHAASVPFEVDSDGGWRIVDQRMHGTNAITMLMR